MTTIKQLFADLKRKVLAANADAYDLLEKQGYQIYNGIPDTDKTKGTAHKLLLKLRKLINKLRR